MSKRGPKHGDMGVDWDADAIRASKAPYPYTDPSFFNYFKELVKPYDRVLEVGCQIASWVWAWWGVEPTIQYEGLDWSEVALKIAEERYGPGGTDVGEHFPAKFYLMDAREMDFKEEYDIAFCLPPDTLIKKDDGSYAYINSPIEKTLTHKTRYRTTVEQFSRHYSGKLIQLSVIGSNDKLRPTPEHNLRIVRRDNIYYPCGSKRKKPSFIEEWVPAKDVKKGDHLVLCFDDNVEKPPYFDFADISTDKKALKKYNEVLNARKKGLSYTEIYKVTGIPRKTVHQWCTGLYVARGVPKISDENRFILSSSNLQRELPRYIEVNNDFLELLGYYASDGSSQVCKSSNGVYFYFNKDESDYAENVRKLMRMVFWVESKIIESGNSLVVYIKSKSVAMFLKMLFPSKGPSLVIPRWIMKLTPTLQEPFIRGYWKGDGTPSTNGFSIDTSSMVAGYQLRDILLRLGIFASVQNFIQKEGKIKGRSLKNGIEYHVRVTGEGIKKFSKIVDYRHPCINERNRTYSKVILHQNKLYLPITKIEEIQYKGPVHNLGVEEDNSYTTHIGTVHNCHTFYQHTNIETKRFVVPAVFRALKPGGLHIIQENTSYDSLGTWFREGWIKFFTGYGFELVRLHDIGGGGTGFVFRKPVEPSC